MAHTMGEIDLIAALEGTAADPIGEAKINALKAIQQKKIRTLMNSIDALKQQVADYKAQSTTHRQNAQIRALKDALRSQELAVDVLKGELLKERNALGKATDAVQMDEWLIQRTVGGPKRFRPRTREELQVEIDRLQKRVRKMQGRLEKREGAASQRHARVPKLHAAARPPSPAPAPEPASVRNVDAEQRHLDELRERGEMLTRLEELSVSLRCSEALVEQLGAETRSLRSATPSVSAESVSRSGVCT